MGLSKESEAALLECVRILAPAYSATERRNMARITATYIGKGQWVPAWLAKDIARLFYPRDAQRADALLGAIQAAIAAGELKCVAGGSTLLASDLVAWPDCPAVPVDSPLRYWLPEFMREGASASASPIREAQPTRTPEPQWKEDARTRAMNIISSDEKKSRYPSQVELGDQIAREWRERGKSGPDGKPLTGAYIKRHALNGIKSGATPRESARIRRGK